MYPESDKNYVRVHKTGLLVVVLVLAAGIFGWWLGHKNTPSASSSNTGNTSSATSESVTPKTAVNDLITYTLPDNWKQGTCDASKSVLVTPPTTTLQCGTDPSAPIKLAVDPGDTKDCNQLQSQSDVKKHVCISLFINGHKTLKATTEYLASSSYKQDTTINSYYIDTGKGVVQVTYQYTADNQFQAGFDQLVNSVKVKG